MKEKILKMLPLIESILLVVIALLMVISSFMSAVKLNTEDYSIESFTEGSLTSDIPVGEVKVGTFVLFDMLFNMEEFNYVVKVQSIEAELRRVDENIAKSEMYNPESLIKERNELQKELADVKADFDDESMEKLDELLYDDGFINALAVRFMLSDILTNMLSNISEPPVAFSLMAIFFVIMLVGVVALSVVAVIGFVKKLTYFIKTIKSPSAESAEELAPKKAGVVVPVFMIALLGVTKVFIGGTAVLGAGAIFGLILCLACYAIRIANRVLFTNESGKVKLVAKSVMSLLSAILVLVFMLNLFALDIVGSLFDSKDGFVANYVISNPSKGALDEAESIFGGKVWIAVVVGVVLFIVSLIALASCVERFGMKLNKAKDGTKKPYKACLVLSIFMIVLAIVNCFFGVGTVEARDDAAADGSVKILWDSYKIEGTEEYIKYEALVDGIEAEEKLLDEFKKELKDADDDDAKKFLENSIIILERGIEKTEKTIDDVKTSQKLNMVVCIIISVLFIALEFTYNKLPDIIESKLGDKFKKKKSATVEK